MKKTAILLSILLMLLAVACQSQSPAVTPTNTPPPTAEIAEPIELPTETVGIAPTAEPTATIEAIATEPVVEATATSGGAEATGVLPRVEPLEECFIQPPEGLDVTLDLDCGFIGVPQFHNQPNDQEVKLSYIRINSGQGNTASPLFMLLGGPGDGYIDPNVFRYFDPLMLGNILEARDVILLDQRGTKNTGSFLDCSESHSLAWQVQEQGLDKEAATALQIDTLKNCIDRLKTQGIDLNAYNSLESAADVSAARQALGYDKIIYYGASYGSILGQHVMRDFPETLEGVVLDGASPLARKSWVEDRALDAQWGIDNLTALCQADEKCNAAYDIPAMMDKVTALFADGPLTFPYTDPADPSISFDVQLTEADLYSFIYGQQGSANGVSTLPAYLLQFSEGGVETLQEIFAPMLGGGIVASRTATEGSQAALMHYAVVCAEDRVESVDDVKLDGVGRYGRVFGQNAAEGYATACDLLDVAELPDSTDENVTSDIPTLILAGGLDVSTPTFRTQEVADTLTNDTYVVFPDGTHVQISAINLCAGQIMTQFVLNPGQPPDTACAQEPSTLAFILPDGSPSKEFEE